MGLIQIIVLALIQGAAELLPVSSSAHVIVAERLMGLKPSDPNMIFLLVMLHTGTMFAVLWHYWARWKTTLARSAPERNGFIVHVLLASAATSVVALSLKHLIETYCFDDKNTDIEALFDKLPLIAGALAAVGVLIVGAGMWAERRRADRPLNAKGALLIGLVQGLCLPFRGFSRSGSTISTGLLLGNAQARVEEFSFALAVVLTPAIIGRGLYHLLKLAPEGSRWMEKAQWLFHNFNALLLPGLLGLLFSFIAGLVALKLLSAWIERGRWKFFGLYCLVFACVVLWVERSTK